MLHYEAKPDHGNEALTARLVELAHERRRFGYRRLHSWSVKAFMPITSACIAFIVRPGWPCDAVVGATAS